MNRQEYTVPQECHGQRLDKALEAFFPELSVRARRRLWDEAEVLVNGKLRRKGFVVLAGDVISLVPVEQAIVEEDASPAFSLSDPPRFLHSVSDPGSWCFVYKPAGLHTASLQGRGGACLESMLGELVPASWLEASGAGPQLCMRLDYGTSGLVVAAEDEEALQSWKHLENAGLCEKRYVALLQGHMDVEITVQVALDTDKRRISRALPYDAEALRHTVLTPLALVSGEEVAALAELFPGIAEGAEGLTVAGCCIHKGARHQIRAHAAHAGFPLWNDRRYAREEEEKQENFVLHHGGMVWPQGFYSCLPPWISLLPKKIGNDIAQWLQGAV